MQTLESPSPAIAPELDLAAAIRHALEASPEPMTLSKIRAALPSKLRTMTLEELAETLGKMAAANTILQYPKYRSPQDRFWDRPMRMHVVYLLKSALTEKPLALSELRRKLPDYAKEQAETVLMEEVAQGTLFRHPPASSRGGPRFGAEAPNPKMYLKDEMAALFARLEKLGFSEQQLRQGATELLHEAEWGPAEQRTPDMMDPNPTMYAADDERPGVNENQPM